jgi:hypothetical protein
MLPISPELEALLKSRLQAGESGFRGRVEILQPTVGGSPLLGSSSNGTATSVSSWQLPRLDVSGNNVALYALVIVRPKRTITPAAGWVLLESRDFNEGATDRVAIYRKVVATSETPYEDTFTTSGVAQWGVAQLAFRSVATQPENHAIAQGIFSCVTDPSQAATLPSAPTVGYITLAFGIANGCGTPPGYTGELRMDWGADYTEIADVAIPASFPRASVAYRVDDGTAADLTATGTWLSTNIREMTVAVVEAAIEPEPAGVQTIHQQVHRIGLDKGLRLVCNEAEVEFPNEGMALGWGAGSIFTTNQRVRIYQWYGDPANEVRCFTGLIDAVNDHRDVLTTSLTCRDMFALLVDQTFGATAPQQADEAGAVRTAENGVYLSMEISAIVDDLLDRAGWPVADRAITPTSYLLDEYVVEDGWTWAEAIVGEDRLTGLTGYDAWADEDGVFHFAPTYSSGALTDPAVPTYTFRAGEDITALDDATDQYELRTRVKIRGPLTTQVLTDTWRQLWKTNKISRPVGLWYDPTNTAIIRVIDGGTKRLYRIRQSDRVVLGSVYLGGVISHPLGLSGDPADSSIYWVLHCPWYGGGAATGNRVYKMRKSDHVKLAQYDLPDGRWSAIKVSSSFMWLTNLDTDRFYKRDKADASAIASYQHTYGGTLQANPSGLMIDGTELSLFWANGGTTARFLVCDESDPTTITKRVRTAGTTLHGGEMDTTTHTECYGDSDSLGLVAKFTLVAVSEQTSEVYSEVVDIDLEDELGSYAQSESRVHDAHSGDDPHPFEIRRDTVDLTAITSLAQATESAQRRLDKLSQRRRVLDVGILGNPALQVTDLVRVEDPPTGLASDWLIDTYRSEMVAEDTYLGVLALLPVSQPDDDPTDDGDASE